MNVNSGMVVQRREAEEVEATRGWSLIFGRRKVGKTYMLRNFITHDAYFSVRTDGAIMAEGAGQELFSEISGFVSVVKSLLKRKKTVVLDEFQRLPHWTLEEIATMHPHGRLILSGSSMGVVEKVIGRNSPLLGIVEPYKLGPIHPRDILMALDGRMDVALAVEIAPFLRDPWTIPFMSRPEDFLRTIVKMSRYVVPGLTGEIFTEEDRGMTKTYSSILALIGRGISDPREISNILYLRGVIKRKDTSLVIPYIKNMVRMGLLEQTRVYGKKRHIYTIASEAMALYYYIASRYDIDSREFSMREMEPAVKNFRNIAIERFFSDLFASELDGRREWSKTAEKEIDILITVRNRPVLVGEVKWGRVRKRDVDDFLDKVEDFHCKKILITKNAYSAEGVEVMSAAPRLGDSFKIEL